MKPPKVKKDYKKIIKDLEDELVRKEKIIKELKEENMLLFRTAVKQSQEKLKEKSSSKKEK